MTSRDSLPFSYYMRINVTSNSPQDHSESSIFFIYCNLRYCVQACKCMSWGLKVVPAGGRSFETDILIVPSFDIMACTGLAASRCLMLKINKARIPTLRMLERVLLQDMFCIMKRGRVMCILHEKIMTFIDQNRHKHGRRHVWASNYLFIYIYIYIYYIIYIFYLTLLYKNLNTLILKFFLKSTWNKFNYDHFNNILIFLNTKKKT